LSKNGATPSVAWVSLSHNQKAVADGAVALKKMRDVENTSQMIAHVIYLHSDEHGKSKYTDYKKAAEWYKKAYELGNLKGAFNYANMLHYGRGVRRNHKKAYELFARLFDIGYPGAAFYVGLYNQEGYCVKKDYGVARHCYIVGATAGDPYCYNQLGRIYGLGLGVRKDVNFAFDYYMTAAELGDALSATNVGWSYETGAGVIPDIAAACKWYAKAAREGEEHAIEALKRLDGYKSALTLKEFKTVEKYYRYIEMGEDGWTGVGGDAPDEVRKSLLPVVERVITASKRGDAII
jgi:TPR repeat protein